MEYYIHNIPVFVLSPVHESVDLPIFCQEVEELLPASLLQNIEVVYVGNFKELEGRNAAFANAAIYIIANEPTNFDMVENFVHEVAHSLETGHGWEIYDDNLINEFLGKRKRLRSLLEAEGFEINPLLYDMTEYNKKFDDFLSEVVGYPALLNLTMGLFVSPYGATSIQEYFANGFEKFFLDSPRLVRDISPTLYQKIESILNDNT
jgi:hypothetical protein